jgi:predicted MFS family arabinose efflux permease
MYRVLRDPRFSCLLLGHALNGIGSWAGILAIWGYAAYEFNLGPSELALLTLAWGLPSVVVAPLGGVLIDRVGPRRVAVTADVCNAFVALAMLTADGITLLMLLALMHGVGKAFTGPAYSVLPSRVVPTAQLFEANALFSAASDLAMVLGPVLAAAVVASYSPEAAFVADAVTYLLAAATTIPLRIRQAPGDEGRSSRGSWWELRDELLRATSPTETRSIFVLGFALWLTFGAFIVLEPLLVRDVMKQPVTTFALLQTAFGVGLVGAGLALPRLSQLVQTPAALGRVLAVGGITATMYAGTSLVPVAFVASTAWGATVALFTAPSRTLLLRTTSEDAHGRVLGAFQAVTNLGQLTPALLLPLLPAVDTQRVLVGASVLLFAAGAAVASLTPSPASSRP